MTRFETIKQTNLGAIEWGGQQRTKDERLGAISSCCPVEQTNLLSFARCGCRGQRRGLVNPFRFQEFPALGLSKVHLPWLRHRNIPQACNDNISRPSCPPTATCVYLLYLVYILALGELAKLGCSFKPSGVCCVPFSFCGVDETLMTLRTHSRGKWQKARRAMCPASFFASSPGIFLHNFTLRQQTDKAG